MADVGDGSTSDNLEGGSFLSAFHIAVPHGKAVEALVWARFKTLAGDAACAPQAAAPVAGPAPALASMDGVLG